MITLTNLTPLQRELCDHIWSMDDPEELKSWIQVLIDVMIMEYMDQQEITEFSDAQAIIETIQKR